MRKLFLTLLSLLPISNISMAASMRLDELSNNEKIEIIQEVLRNHPNESFDQIQIDNDIDSAIIKLAKDGFIIKNIEAKKSSGAESVGGH